jgi:hypothetical protein
VTHNAYQTFDEEMEIMGAKDTLITQGIGEIETREGSLRTIVHPCERRFSPPF